MWNDYPEIASELNLVEEYINEKVRSRNKLLSEIVSSLINAGGKRLRPAMTVISAKFGNYDREKVLSIAGALEILHTATLVHDDIIDKAKLRRGKNTVSEKYGIDMAVYTGDFLFTKAVLMLSKDISIEKLDTVASAVKTICEGEVDQYIDKYNSDTTALSYLKRISKKTAVLFSASCGLGAYVAGCPEDISRKLAKFGFYYGMAFQLKDDINDLVSDEATEGKPVANDVSEGILTLPAIIAMRKDPLVRASVTALLDKKSGISKNDLTQAVYLIKEFQGIEDTRDIVEKYIKRGLDMLDKLPDNSYNKLLRDMIYRL